MLPIKIYKPGEKIKIIASVIIDGRERQRPTEYTVIKQYPHHILVIDKYGIRRSICNADIYCMKYQRTVGERHVEEKLMTAAGKPVRICKRVARGSTA